MPSSGTVHWSFQSTRWGHLPSSESACSCWCKWRASLHLYFVVQPFFRLPSYDYFLHYDHFLAFTLSSHERTNGLYCLLSKPLKFLFLHLQTYLATLHFKKKFFFEALQFLNQAKFSSQRVCTYLFIVLEILLHLLVTFPCLLK